MHYLIIAVLTLGLSLLGCEGKTGPAGPSGAAGVAGPAGPAGPQGSTGPAGPAGPAGADGAQGPQGEKGDTGETGPAGPAGPAGPQGPAGADGADGAAGIPGIDITEIAKADHIAFIIGDAKAAKANLSKTLRIGEEREIRAVLRSQSEEVLESIDVVLTEKKDADNAVETDVDADDASMAMLTAEKIGEATIMATAPLVGIAGELKYTVTNPITKITLHVGDPAKTKTVAEDDLVAHGGEEVLADGEASGVIQAVARDKNNDPLTPRGGFKWIHDNGSVATVALRDHNYKPAKDIKTHSAIITGKGAGETMVTVMVMGESELGDPASKDIDVSVSGQVTTRLITASNSSQLNNTFEADLGDASPAWDPSTITFTVDLYDAVSRDRIAGTVTAVSGNTDVVTVTATVSPTADAGAEVTVTPVGVFTGDDALTAGSRSAIVTLTSVGAKPVKLRFVTTVEAAPE